MKSALTEIDFYVVRFLVILLYVVEHIYYTITPPCSVPDFFQETFSEFVAALMLDNRCCTVCACFAFFLLLFYVDIPGQPSFFSKSLKPCFINHFIFTTFLFHLQSSSPSYSWKSHNFFSFAIENAHDEYILNFQIQRLLSGIILLLTAEREVWGRNEGCKYQKRKNETLKWTYKGYGAVPAEVSDAFKGWSEGIRWKQIPHQLQVVFGIMLYHPNNEPVICMLCLCLWIVG